MAVNVRIFGYRGLAQLAEWPRPTFFNAVQPLRLNEPYEWSQVINVPAAAPIFSSPVNPDLSTLLKIEVPDGWVVQYDVNQPVGGNSPLICGTQVIQWSPGWQLSLIQAGALVVLAAESGSPILTSEAGVILTP